MVGPVCGIGGPNGADGADGQPVQGGPEVVGANGERAWPIKKETISRIPVDWMLVTAATFTITFLLTRSDLLNEGRLNAITWCLGGMATGLCLWKTFEGYREVELQEIKAARRQERIEQLDRAPIDDPELWKGLQETFEPLFEGLLVFRWGENERTQEQKELSTLLARVVTLQIKRAAEEGIARDWEGSAAARELLGDPQAVRDLVVMFTQGSMGQSVKILMEGMAHTLQDRLGYQHLLDKRPGLMKKSADWTVELLEKLNAVDGNLEGKPDALLERVSFQSDKVCETRGEEIDAWMGVYKDWLDVSFKDLQDPIGAECRVAARLMRFGLAMGTVILADNVLSEESIDTMYFRAVEALDSNDPRQPPEAFMLDGESEQLDRVIQAFVANAGGAGRFGQWLVGKLSARIVEATNGGLNRILLMKDHRQEFNPEILNDVLKQQIRDLENPPDQEELDRRHAEHMRMKQRVQTYQFPGLTGLLANGTVGLSHAIKWSHQAAHLYRETVLRHLVYTALEEGLAEVREKDV